MKRRSGVVSIVLVALLVFTLFTPLVVSASHVHRVDRRYSDARAKYLDTREKYQRFERSDPNKDQIGQAKAYVENVLDYLIAYLEMVKAKIEVLEENGARPRVSSSNLQADIDELEAFKIELEGCETKDEVLEVVKRIRSSWAGINEDVRYCTNFISYYQIGRNIERMEAFSAGMGVRLDALESAGVDVSDLRAYLSEFDRHLESARDEYNTGLRFYEEDELRDASSHFRNAQKHLILANRILKVMVRAYMGMRG
ncbi:MAG: conserved hypothetical protein, secreted [Candidatus Syntrophoarchaeum caldarius]|uniref:Uncharacterized protein n=1 Tax=Candidatus Syntropharchaeum caldarium TaxID=1838285 RepID=A0A1F2P903_9EURY|nr:MAG: conserved hypothetical protein, secreted [Candidatus Syntrophoarchaeum caldarius]